jgi:curved DNA-binding protein CbpA
LVYVGGLTDYYELLGVPRNAKPDDLRQAYREAALRYHPDRKPAPGDTDRFLEIGQAYETLIDPESRIEYDIQLTAQEKEQIDKAPFVVNILHGREALLQLGEPQVHYLLLDVLPSPKLPGARAAINLSIGRLRCKDNGSTKCELRP